MAAKRHLCRNTRLFFVLASFPHLLVLQLRALFVDESHKRADEPQKVSGGHVVPHGGRVGRGVRRRLLHAPEKNIGCVVAEKYRAKPCSVLGNGYSRC